MSRNKLIYYGGVKDEGIVFVQQQDACRLARIYWAASTSTTWGEFASKVQPDVMDEILQHGSRISFHSFCRTWLYQALAWSERTAAQWFCDCIAAYRSLQPDIRYPLPEEEYSPHDVFGDGAWPPSPQQLTSRWCPQDVMQRYGERRLPLHDFAYVYFEPRHTKQIVRDLISAGFMLVRANELVKMACGYLPHDLGADEQRSLIEIAEQNQ